MTACRPPLPNPQQWIYLSDALTHVLDDHLVSSNGLHGKQTPLVDSAAAKPQFLFSELQAGDKNADFLITGYFSPPSERAVTLLHTVIMK